mmetsp:Transcript_29103/g.93874  ORF Transcript_29103/g.93874 Transcript_29103/m.93874 type:complete len:140 (-) Transcript_29103:884-1303(-)
MATTVYAEPVDVDEGDEAITSVFASCGEVVHVSVPRRDAEARRRGFAFVEFRDADGARRAIERLDGTSLFPDRPVTRVITRIEWAALRARWNHLDRSSKRRRRDDQGREDDLQGGSLPKKEQQSPAPSSHQSPRTAVVE